MEASESKAAMYGTDCCICLSSTENRISPCLHPMCKACIQRWCQRRITCPVCNSIVLSPCPAGKWEKEGEGGNVVVLLPTTEWGQEEAVLVEESCDGEAVVSMGGVSVGRCLRLGDAIVSVNEIPVSDYPSVVCIMHESITAGHPLRLEVDRKREERACKTCASSLRKCLHMIS